MSRPAAKTEAEKPSLESLRRRIDEIDRKILDLIAMRAGIVEQVGHLKHSTGEVVYAPSRERAIYERMIAENPGPLGPEAIKRIYTEIISACRALEHLPRVAYLGPEHTYSHEAARSRFGSSVEFVPESSIAGVFQALDNARADFGVVPVENSTDGTITMTLDLLIDTSLVIIGEILLPVRHSIGSREGDASRVRKIVSHQQSLAQCRGYLAANFPRCELEAVASNAFAARRARGSRLRRDRLDHGAGGQRPQAHRREHPGSRDQHHAVFGDGQAGGGAMRRRQDHRSVRGRRQG